MAISDLMRRADRLAGTLPKDDVLARVGPAGLDPEITAVGEVMTSRPPTAATETSADEALALMFSRNQCFLPVVESPGTLRGWLAICQPFKDEIEDLSRQLDSLEAYIATDGPEGSPAWLLDRFPTSRRAAFPA